MSLAERSATVRSSAASFLSLAADGFCAPQTFSAACTAALTVCCSAASGTSAVTIAELNALRRQGAGAASSLR